MNFLFNGIFAIGVFFGICFVIAFEFFFDFFGKSIDPPEALVATIFGAAIALSGTIFTIYAAREERKDRQYDLDKVRVLEIYSKVLEIHNALIKVNRHLSTEDPRSIIELTESSGAIHNIWKPAEDPPVPVKFSNEETAAAIRMMQAWMFNFLNDLQGASEQLSFLTSLHLREVKELQKLAVRNGEFNLSGRELSSSSEIDTLLIMRIEDIEAHLRRLLSQALPEAQQGHKRFVEYIESEFKINVQMDIDPTIPGVVFSD